MRRAVYRGSVGSRLGLACALRRACLVRKAMVESCKHVRQGHCQSAPAAYLGKGGQSGGVIRLVGNIGNQLAMQHAVVFVKHHHGAAG